eukprot:SAG11_NODE_29713_length_308_cov_0.679426_1_plen_40_part_10
MSNADKITLSLSLDEDTAMQLSQTVLGDDDISGWTTVMGT